MSVFGKYVMANAAKNAFDSSTHTIRELNDAFKEGRATPVYSNDTVVGIKYRDNNGFEKTVSKKDVLAAAKRMRTSVYIMKKIIGQI